MRSQCINQDDDADKCDQISKMDIIYSHAAITFINATRESQKHGLPGISTISRVQQLQETFKNVTFVQCFPEISTMVKASPWSTRGWTFQEGFFAPRRVIFTEYGTSYLCHRGIVPMATNVNTETLKLELYWKSAADWIPEYTNRRFMYSSDALNACRGILNYFRCSADPAYSNWGVPILYVASDSYVFELGWRHDFPATRRDAFPSWSFLGWEGSVTTGTIRVVPETLYLGDYQELFLEVKDVERKLRGRRVLQEENDYRLRYLHYKSKVIYLSLVHNDWTTDQMKHRTSVRYPTLRGIKTEFLDLIPAGTHASLRLAPNLYMLTYVYYDRESLGRSGHIGVKLDPYRIEVSLSWVYFGIRLLILENHGGLYERVGMTSFSLRSDPNTRVAFTNAAGELLDKVDLITVLPYFLTKAKEQTVVIS
ncbi:hypothetical protein ACHAQJ_010736 [Trichoderma viride]